MFLNLLDIDEFLFTFRHYTIQVRDPGVSCSATIDSNEVSSGLAWTPPGEVVVGGVYLRLFVANPQWTLRSPRTFLADLLDTIMTSLQKDGQVLLIYTLIDQADGSTLNPNMWVYVKKSNDKKL